MAENNEKPTFEGKNRRVRDRRMDKRRKVERIITILEYIGMAVFLAVVIKIFSL